MLLTKSKILRIICVIVICVIGFFSFFNHNVDKETFNVNEKKYCICAQPDIRPNNQKLTLIDENGERLLATVDSYPRYKYGGCLLVSGEIQNPGLIDDFDYGRYLERFGIYHVSYYPRVEPIGISKANFLKKIIYKFKDKMQALINLGLEEPEAGLASAYILNNKQFMPADLNLAFSQTGLSHIVAISGMHISLLSAMLMASLLFIGLNRKSAFYFCLILLTLYTFLVGYPASAVRSYVMAFYLLLAMYLGRLTSMTNSILFTATIMLIINPKLLRDDMGFQLSFLAVIGIIIYYPKLKSLVEKYNFSKITRAVLDIIAVTLSAQVLVLPLIVYRFQIISLVSILANLLVVWTLPALMIFLLLALALSFLVPQLATLFFLPSYVLLKYIILTTKYLSGLPYAYIQTGYIHPFWILAYYLLIVYLHSLFKKRKKLSRGEYRF